MDEKAIDQLDCMIFLVFSLTTWLSGMIIIDIPSVLELLPVVLKTEQETLLLVIVYCIPGPLSTSVDHFILLMNEVQTKQDFDCWWF